jgi:tRNA G18 (ribose-2'-O)-methylase SpoU
LGSTDTVLWEGYENPMDAIIQLKNDGYKIYAIEQVHNSVFLNKLDVNVNEKIALIFGNEADGVSEELIELSDGCVEIPQAGSKHSFNISVAAGIVLWHLYNKIKL